MLPTRRYDRSYGGGISIFFLSVGGMEKYGGDRETWECLKVA